jgi:penicillin-binding protein 2
MNPDLLLKNAYQETQLFRRRIVIAAFIVISFCAILVARLVYLQIIMHEHFTTLSEDNRLQVQPIAPARGLIYDRNGVILAENQPTFSLDIVPEQVVGDLDDLLAELQRIVPISDYDLTRFHKQRRQKRRFDKIPLRFHLNDEEVAKLAVQHHRLPGMYISANLSRYYPLRERGVHVLGYVGRINEKELERIDPVNYRASTHIGKVGIEKSYEDVLHGSVGHQQIETNVQGRIVRVIKKEPPVQGNNVYLNIDIRLQIFAEELLQDRRAALVALDPRSAEVLAMVSTPTYDPNAFVNGIDVKSYHALRDSPDRPLFNRILRGRYPPGSTIKAMVGLAGLHHGVITTDSKVFCPGFYQLPGRSHKYRDWKRQGHGLMNLHRAVEESCDVYFYELANRLNIDRMSHFLKKFSFGRLTGIDIDGEMTGLMPTSEWKRKALNTPWYPGETLISGIGQGFSLATPLQLAVATAALAQRGHLNSPRVAFAVQNNEKNKRDVVNAPTLINIELPQTYWDIAINAMHAVVHGSRGTARRQSADISYQMAGKSGTAQVIAMAQDEEAPDDEDVPEHHQDHALFIAFAPLENPRIAVAVIVENGGSGSRTAAPIVRQVIDYYLLELSG